VLASLASLAFRRPCIAHGRTENTARQRRLSTQLPAAPARTARSKSRHAANRLREPGRSRHREEPHTASVRCLSPPTPGPQIPPPTQRARHPPPQTRPHEPNPGSWIIPLFPFDLLLRTPRAAPPALGRWVLPARPVGTVGLAGEPVMTDKSKPTDETDKPDGSTRTSNGWTVCQADGTDTIKRTDGRTERQTI
jgi:hypothetical protein